MKHPVVKTERVDVFHVEIRYPGRQNEWNHIYSDWEETDDLDVARAYAERVRVDIPEGEIRIVRTKRSRVTVLATGEVRGVLELGTQIERS